MSGRMRLPILFSTFFVLASAALSQVNTSGKPSGLAEEQDYAFAYGLFKDGMYQLAADQFDQFVKKYPSSMKKTDAVFLSIESRFQQQRFDTAARLFGRFVAEYPNSRLTDDASLRLGESFLRLKKNQEALVPLKDILDRFAQSELAGEAAYWIGEAYVRTGDYENAIKYYSLAFEHYPANRLRDYALYAIGWTYQTKGDYTRAAAWYTRLPKEFPASDLVSASLVRNGECFFYMKEYRKAIQELAGSSKGITKAEEKGEAEYLVAEAYYHLGEFEQARIHYELFVKEYPGHRLERDVLYALGWTYLKIADYPRAEQAFDELVSGSDALAHSGLFRKGVAEKFGGKTGEALTTWTEVTRKAPQGEFSDNALYESGLLLYEQNKPSEARPFFERVTKEYPSSDVLADSYRMAGECLVADSNFAKAREVFARAIAVPDASFDARVNSLFQLGWSQFKLGQYAEGIQSFSQFLETYGNHPKAADAMFWRAEAEYRLEQYDASSNDYVSVADLKSVRQEDALYGAGWSYFKLNNFGKAKEQFEKLVAAFPSGKFVFDARLRLGDSFFFLKEYAGAEGAYRTVIRQFPQEASVDYAYYQLGQAYYRRGNYNDAVSQFNELMKLFPKSSLADDAQYAIGWIWFQNKQYPEAIKEFQKVLQNAPESELVPRALYSIGDAYYNLQQYGAAEKTYRDVLNRFPKSPSVADAVSGIQYCLLAQGKQQEALTVIDLFLKENPDAGVAQTLYLKKGDLLYSQQQYDGAIKEYRAFSEKYPGSPLVAAAYYWIGKSYLAQNRTLDAAQAFERAASVNNGGAKTTAQSLLELGDAYLNLKSYEKALEALTRLERSHSESEVMPDAMYLKGTVLAQAGTTADAHRQFNTLVGRFPKTTAADKARLALARIYLKETNFSDAVQFAQHVATSRTDELGAEGQYIIGLTESTQKNWQAAITAYLRVRYIFPTQEEWLAKAYLGLGEVDEQTNEPRRAQEAYQTVLKFERQREAVADAQRRLKRMERP
ncbi:MAG: Outer membrane assembly lipoprotein YfiO [Microgenomates group bacterium GW2011_GWA2_47_8]|nr:MAG: Outer membrane assembly lipoprotein YfiO [Microgenomates group bacterium GW2011_GWA2_47_8]